MEIFSIDIRQIVELGTQVANSGAIRAVEHVADEMFEYIVGITRVVYEQNPR